MKARAHSNRAIFSGVWVVVIVVSMVACGASPAEDANSSLAPTRTSAPVATIDAPTVAPATAPTKAAPEPTAAQSAPQTTATPRVVAAVADTKPAAPACEDVQPNLDSSTPKATTTAGNIVYITPEGNVALTDPAGRKKIDVTTDGFVDRERQALRMYQFPTFSNDGKWLAFVSVSGDATNGLTQTLYVTPAIEKPKLINLYSTAEDNIPYIDWSPDNETVAFLTIGGGAGEIRTVSKSGGPISVLDSGRSVYWHWRNDSAAIVAHLGGAYSSDGDAHISVIDSISQNGEQNTLNRIESLPGRFQSPQYSPDGKFMLFVLGVDREVDDLMLADASGKLICTVTRMEAGAFFAWSPNGTQIAYLDTLAPVQQPGPLSILDLKTGKKTIIDRSAMMFFWSPDGAKIALYSLVTDGKLPQLGRTSGKLAAPALQNNATALRIEVIDAATGDALTVADTLPTRDFLQFFQFFDQYSRAVTPWSPDSSSLVFITVNSASQTADVGIATLGKTKNAFTLSRVAAGSVAFWSPQ